MPKIQHGHGIQTQGGKALTLMDLVNFASRHPELRDLPIEHSDPEGNFPKPVQAAVYDKNEDGQDVVWVFG